MKQNTDVKTRRERERCTLMAGKGNRERVERRDMLCETVNCRDTRKTGEYERKETMMHV